jgi:hypothetical protein
VATRKSAVRTANFTLTYAAAASLTEPTKCTSPKETKRLPDAQKKQDGEEKQYVA